jgi:hypothetical protein
MSVESKTKERILLDRFNHYRYASPLDSQTERPVLEAMEQYSMNKSIEFALWIEDENYVKSRRGKDKWYQYPYTEETKYFNTTQLYELFSHQTEK